MATNISDRGYINTGVKTTAYSKLAVPGYTTIKYRKREPQAFAPSKPNQNIQDVNRLESSDHGIKRPRSSTGPEEAEESPIKKPKFDETSAADDTVVEIPDIDKDDELSSDSESSRDGDDKSSSKEAESDIESDGGDDEEELAEIQMQLERIRKEKVAEREKAEREATELARQEKEAKMMVGNPLMAGQTGEVGFGVKKWYEETLFKNQAAGETQYTKRFINDTVRNDFHKKFLAKYIR